MRSSLSYIADEHLHSILEAMLKSPTPNVAVPFSGLTQKALENNLNKYRQPQKNDSNDISLGRSKVEVLWTVRRFDGSYFNTKCSISVQIAH